MCKQIRHTYICTYLRGLPGFLFPFDNTPMHKLRSVETCFGVKRHGLHLIRYSTFEMNRNAKL